MSSDVDVCNTALSHLGDEAEVVAIVPPDGSIQSKHCGRFYPIARDRLLEMHPWSFAVKRVTLANLTAIAGWTYAYGVPTAMIRPLSILPDTAPDDSTSDEFIVETQADGTKVVYTNTQNATLRYIDLITDTTKFTPGFVAALSRLLAHYLAGPILKGMTGIKVGEEQLKIFMVEVAAAKSADSNSGSRNSYRDFVPAGIKARAAAPYVYGPYPYYWYR